MDLLKTQTISCLTNRKNIFLSSKQTAPTKLSKILFYVLECLNNAVSFESLVKINLNQTISAIFGCKKKLLIINEELCKNQHKKIINCFFVNQDV